MAAEGEGGHGVNSRVKGVVVSDQEGADQARKHVAGPDVGLKGRGTVRQAGQAGAVSDDVDFAGQDDHRAELFGRQPGHLLEVGVTLAGVNPVALPVDPGQGGDFTGVTADDGEVVLVEQFGDHPEPVHGGAASDRVQDGRLVVLLGRFHYRLHFAALVGVERPQVDGGGLGDVDHVVSFLRRLRHHRRGAQGVEAVGDVGGGNVVGDGQDDRVGFLDGCDCVLHVFLLNLSEWSPTNLTGRMTKLGQMVSALAVFFART